MASEAVPQFLPVTDEVPRFCLHSPVDHSQYQLVTPFYRHASPQFQPLAHGATFHYCTLGELITGFLQCLYPDTSAEQIRISDWQIWILESDDDSKQHWKPEKAMHLRDVMHDKLHVIVLRKEIKEWRWPKTQDEPKTGICCAIL